MTAEGTDPVVLVIDGDKQNVRPGRFRRLGVGERQDGNDQQGVFIGHEARELAILILFLFSLPSDECARGRGGSE